MAYIYESGAWTDYEPHKYGVNTVSFTTYPFTIKSPTTPVTATIYGNMQQSGTPTPTNPIQPNECGERTENLFDDHNIITIASLGDRYGVVLPEGTYSIYNGTDNIVYDGINDLQNRHVACEAHSTATVTLYTDPNTTCGFLMELNAASQGGVTIVSGSTPPSSYIPYGYKIPILSGVTTTNVYLGEVQTTRRIKKLVLDGTEEWGRYTPSSNPAYMFLDLYNSPDIAIVNIGICTHLTSTIISSNNNNEGFGIQNRDSLTKTSLLIRNSDMGMSTVDDFKAYLAAQYAAGTPVTVWYVLATPETAIVNEPIRKIGDYSDGVTASIPVIIGSDAIDIDTTLKPSAVAAPSLSWGSGEDHKYSGGSWG